MYLYFTYKTKLSTTTTTYMPILVMVRHVVDITSGSNNKRNSSSEPTAKLTHHAKRVEQVELGLQTSFSGSAYDVLEKPGSFVSIHTSTCEQRRRRRRSARLTAFSTRNKYTAYTTKQVSRHTPTILCSQNSTELIFCLTIYRNSQHCVQALLVFQE